MAVNLGGDRKVVGEGDKLPQGIDATGVEELPRGYETSGVTTKGEIVPGDDGQVRGGDRNTPTNRETKARGSRGCDEGMTRKMGPAPPPIPQRGMSADRYSSGTPHRHPGGTDDARP